MHDFMRAIGSQNVDMLSSLLESGFGPNERIPYSGAPDAPAVAIPLLLTVREGWNEGTELLLSHGANADETDEQGMTALMYSALYGHAEIVRLLLERGADPGLLDESGCNALACAVGSFEGPIVAMLRKAGATMPPGDEFRTSGLHLSAVEGDLAECEHLIRARADVNLLDVCGLTPLHCAAHAGHVAVMRLLLDTGARIDQRSCDFDEKGNLLPEQGPTAIGHAIWGSQFEAVRFLLDAGADVHGRFFDGEGDGFTVLAWAAREGSWKKGTSILRLLLDRGVRDDLRGALGRAAYWGFEEGVKLLLEYGAGKNRDDLLFAMKRTTEDNGLGVLPILYEAGQTLDPPLSLPEILSRLEEERDGITFFALRALRDAGINPDEIE